MSYFKELHPEMDRYLEDTASAEPEILKKIEKETFQKTTNHDFWLSPRKISFFDFKMISENILNWNFHRLCSMIVLAEGLQKDGKLTTLDVNEDLAYLPQNIFA